MGNIFSRTYNYCVEKPLSWLLSMLRREVEKEIDRAPMKTFYVAKNIFRALKKKNLKEQSVDLGKEYLKHVYSNIGKKDFKKLKIKRSRKNFDGIESSGIRFRNNEEYDKSCLCFLWSRISRIIWKKLKKKNRNPTEGEINSILNGLGIQLPSSNKESLEFETSIDLTEFCGRFLGIHRDKKLYLESDYSRDDKYYRREYDTILKKRCETNNEELKRYRRVATAIGGVSVGVAGFVAGVGAYAMEWTTWSWLSSGLCGGIPGILIGVCIGYFLGDRISAFLGSAAMNVWRVFCCSDESEDDLVQNLV